MSLTALAFVALFSIGCIATVFSSAFMGILLYEIQYFLNPPVRWWSAGLPDLRYSFTVVVLILVGYFASFSQYRNNRLRSLPQFKFLCGMVVIVLFTYFFAVNQEEHANFVFKYLKVLLFPILAYKLIDTPEKMEKLLGAYLLGIFYISYVARTLGRSYGGDRMEGIGTADMMDANGCAAILVTAVPLLTFYLLFGSGKSVRLPALIGLVFTLNALVLLNSRGAFIALVVGMIYYCTSVIMEKRSGVARYQMVISAVALCGILLYLTDESFWLRMSTLQEVDTESGGGQRVQFWMKTFEVLEHYPLGAGASGFQLLSPLYLPKEWLTNGVRAVHSLWFEVLSEYGYHGLLVFSGYLFSSLILLRKTRRFLQETGDLYHGLQAAALEASFVSLLVACTFINFFGGELIYWLPFYMGAFANIHLFQGGQNSARQVMAAGI